MAPTDLHALFEELKKEIRRSIAETSAEMPRVYDAEEACKLLGGISRSTLKRMVKKGQIQRCLLGDGFGYPSSEIARIEASRVDAEGTPMEAPIPPRRAPTRREAKADADRMRSATRKKR